jgi:DNA-binding MarR family transcriptional regulator
MLASPAGILEMGADRYGDKLEAEKAQSTVQLLFKAARLLNERAIDEARRRMNKPIRVAHTTLLPHVDLEGTRLTDLASRLGVTKQAAGQLVDELVEMNVLERVPDPADARAKLVRFSARGRAGILEGLAVLREMEKGIEDLVGEKNMRVLHASLTAIVAAEVERVEPSPKR